MTKLFLYDKKCAVSRAFFISKFILRVHRAGWTPVSRGKDRHEKSSAYILRRRERNSIETLSMTPRRNFVRGACVPCSGGETRQSLIIDHRIAAYESSFLRGNGNLTPRFFRDTQTDPREQSRQLSRYILRRIFLAHILCMTLIADNSTNIIWWYKRKKRKNFCNVLRCKGKIELRWENKILLYKLNIDNILNHIFQD